MKKMTKNRKAVFGKHDLTKAYSLTDACNLVKDISTTLSLTLLSMCVCVLVLIQEKQIKWLEEQLRFHMELEKM